MGEYLSTP
jgi:serine/threonine protein phosphatase PrpC